AVIITEALERSFFPAESAVGRRVRMGRGDAEIVGVVGDIRRAGLRDEPRADMYFPFDRMPATATTLFVRTTGDPAAAVPDLQRMLRAVEPSIVVARARTMEAIAAESAASSRLTLWLLGIFAALALALAAVGVYAVMAYAVRQRSREIGTRMALGATRAGIAWMVMRDGGIIVGGGLALGLAAGLVGARALGSLLFDVSFADPSSLGGAAALLALAMALACYVPARRAAQVDPARTLAE
ncbi:MAG TPA: FtsX-like permease family protein, partial [Vicinamibacterales bacterium]|nr:FtsX-like permease family protein [Vicinamibacterales bacterium]